jgi:sec-independent protein translocase protein TatA
MSLLSNLMMQLVGIGGAELIIIAIIFVALIFGSKKMPELARSIGKATTEYEKAKIQVKKEIEVIKNQDINENPNLDRKKLEDIADILGIDYSDKRDNELKIAIDSELRKSRK